MKTEKLPFNIPDIYTELRMDREQRMKTLDEVIAELEDEGLFADALHYLKEYQGLSKMWNDKLDKEQENQPLTWEQLKQMEGKPVWVEFVGGDDWMLVDKMNKLNSNWIQFRLKTGRFI